ncbi:unnamed protein product [Orchesella dallaii]|uniref:Brain protein I3 n=1 Tax=Orchesella dallaii TaxID=48710 RepID=A0ABP1S1D0_9HEXA
MENDKTPVPPVRIQNTPLASSTARKRWKALLGKVTADQATARADERAAMNTGLIDELKQARRRPKMTEGILSLLKSQTDRSEKMFERQKYSAKEMISHKKRANKSQSNNTAGDDSVSAYTIAAYDRQVRLCYQITPEVREKMDKIKDAREAAAKKKMDKKPGIIDKFFQHTILGQILEANPRFYKLDPLVHLPVLCRRCRRPLEETLESRFTSVGILLCILFPIIGILLMYANKEFVCVVCNELYVYGDLTARPIEYDSDNEEDRKN